MPAYSSPSTDLPNRVFLLRCAEAVPPFQSSPRYPCSPSRRRNQCCSRSRCTCRTSADTTSRASSLYTSHTRRHARTYLHCWVGDHCSSKWRRRCPSFRRSLGHRLSLPCPQHRRSDSLRRSAPLRRFPRQIRRFPRIDRRCSLASRRRYRTPSPRPVPSRARRQCRSLCHRPVRLCRRRSSARRRTMLPRPARPNSLSTQLPARNAALQSSVSRLNIWRRM
jgi:hypothetical protein